MPDADVIQMFALERELRTLAVEMTVPHPRECLTCYVHRMLEHGCTGLRWATRFRDLRSRRATALERRLMSKGAGCDCEMCRIACTTAAGTWWWTRRPATWSYPPTRHRVWGSAVRRPGPADCGGGVRDGRRDSDLWGE